MTREQFITKWLGNGEYVQQDIDRMREDLDAVINTMATKFEWTTSTGKCDVCGCHPSILYKTALGTFCQTHAKY